MQVPRTQALLLCISSPPHTPHTPPHTPHYIIIHTHTHTHTQTHSLFPEVPDFTNKRLLCSVEFPKAVTELLPVLYHHTVQLHLVCRHQLLLSVPEGERVGNACKTCSTLQQRRVVTVSVPQLHTAVRQTTHLHLASMYGCMSQWSSPPLEQNTTHTEKSATPHA